MKQEIANAAVTFNLDQVLHILGPLLTIVGVLLTAAGKAIWKKLNLMQGAIDELERKMQTVAALHGVNHPGQEIE